MAGVRVARACAIAFVLAAIAGAGTALVCRRPAAVPAPPPAPAAEFARPTPGAEAPPREEIPAEEPGAAEEVTGPPEEVVEAPSGPAPAPVSAGLSQLRSRVENEKPSAEEIRSREEAVRTQLAKIHSELWAIGGGSWEEWARRLEPFRADLRRKGRGPPRDGFHFLGTRLLGADRIPDEPDWPLRAVLHLDKQLKARGIDLIFVPIPDKELVYPDMLSDHCPPGRLVGVALKRLCKELLDNDVEVIDLATVFSDYRDQTGDRERLYERCDTHWRNLGARIAAAQIAQRLKRYRFVQEALARPALFQTHVVSVPGGDDLAGRDKERILADPSFDDQCVCVRYKDGQVYADVEDSPVILTADSFGRKRIGMGAQTSAHVALNINLPVTLLHAMGSGPQIPAMLAEQGAGYLKGRRVVVWTGVTRQFWGQWAMDELR